jgi:S-adenosylmethionine/arginine decarboxylase-like enzyme
VRVETWPEHGHVNGEVQICNYSQDNRESALALARALLQMLGAKTGEVVVIERGPNRPMCVTDQLSLAEFQECALEPSL